MKLPKLGAVMTTYRESTQSITEDLHSMGFLPFVIDAESTGHRRGIGPCLFEAWARAWSAKCDYIVQLDAGGSHSPFDAPSLIHELENGADIAIGSRFCKGAHYVGNPKRALMSRLAASACNLKTGASISDWTSGYRGFSRTALDVLLSERFSAKMHGWQIEVLNRAIEYDLAIREVPITYTAGRSSFNRSVAWEAFKVWRSL